MVPVTVLVPNHNAGVDALGKATNLTVISGMTGDEQADRGAVGNVDGLGPTSRIPIELPTAGTVLHASDSDVEVRCVVCCAACSAYRYAIHSSV